MMHPNDDFLRAPELDYDGFRAAMREDWGWFSTPARETNIFASKVRTRRIFGFAAVDLTCNAARLERTEMDIRRDNMEYYFVTVRDTGESIVIHNDRVVNITAGDIILLDSTRPLTFISTAQPGCAQWLGLQVPRQMLASHLGFEPQGGVCGPRQAQASRLLCQLALDTVNDAEPAFASTDKFMHLVVYDLLGALFAPPTPLGSRHNDRLFMRVCGIIKDRFADPDISPREVAAEAGISLRYLQKLFTVRGSTCGHHICSARLDHAARLIERRALIKTGQPLSDIAYACGFRDYTHFARGFRRRFGTAPGAVRAGATGMAEGEELGSNLLRVAHGNPG
jgi:AraC family transcriptional activator of tynA and feaB